MINILNIKKMSLREQAVFIAVVLAVVYGFYAQIIGKPLNAQNIRLHGQKNKYISKINELQKAFPDVDAVRGKVTELKKQIDDFSKDIQNMEGKLISETDIDRLVGEISKQAVKINLTSLKQEIKKEGEYSTLYVELEISGDFISSLEYLYRLECLGDFITIEKLEIIKPQEKIGTILTGCILSMPISKTAVKVEFSKPKQDLNLKKDIFGLPVNITVISDIGLKLEGITFSVSNPIALINGQAIVIGGDIDGYTIKSIQRDRVNVEKDGKIFTLVMERGK